MIVDDHAIIIPKAGDAFEATRRKSLWRESSEKDTGFVAAIFKREVLIFIKNENEFFGTFLSKYGIVSARLIDLKLVRSDI